MIRDAFGLIYAGEQNMNLRELVNMRSVGALPVGGRYRAIDFILSNMVNSGIRNVGVIAQKNYHSMMDHLGSGKEWDLSRKTDGLFILPPFISNENTGSYRGVVDAIKGAMGYIRRTTQKYCVLSGSYTVYNMLLDEVFYQHIDTGADITVIYNVEKERDKGDMFHDLRLHMDDSGRVTDLEHNSPLSTSMNVGMDTYIIKKDLLEYLIEDCSARGKYSWVGDVLMGNLSRLKIFGYEHTGYVGRLKSVAAYFKFNLDMLNTDIQKDLFYSGNTIYTKIKDEPPAKYIDGASVKNCMIADGCVIEGTVENSVLFRGAYIGKGVHVKNSIIMQDAAIYQNTVLEHVIVDKQVQIRSGRTLIGDKDFPVIIRKGAIL